MREIEFRGFHIGGGQDIVRITGPDGNARFCGGRWLTGSLVLWADGDASLLRSDPDDDSDLLRQYFVIPETVGEWTGYCDKTAGGSTRATGCGCREATGRTPRRRPR